MSRLIDIHPDDDTLAGAALGDVAAQESLYRQLAGPVFALAQRLVADRAAAEDLFQDSLVLVFQRLHQYRGDAPFGAWVRSIVTSRCLMHLRSPWQRARLALRSLGDASSEEGDMVAAGVGPEADLPDVESTDLVAQIDLSRALARLSPTARAVVWLHDVEGLTHDEIATAFGRTASFSKSQLSRAHEALRGWLPGHEEPGCTRLNSPRLRSVT